MVRYPLLPQYKYYAVKPAAPGFYRVYGVTEDHRLPPHEMQTEAYMFTYIKGGMKFYIEVAKGSRGAYKTRYVCDHLKQALAYYAGTNTGRGYKKRLRVGDQAILKRDCLIY
jgi:hypothetical protein